MTPRFFASADELRAWFHEHHGRLDEQWIGYYKKATGIPSIDWPESVDVALCFGWIDGLRKRHDEHSYKVRFTPRRAGSRWSARNLARMESLIAAGLAEEAGLAAYRARDPEPPDNETAATELPEDVLSRIREVPAAWQYFTGIRPSYRKQVAAWITSARKEETRKRRLETLIESCAQGLPIPPLRWLGDPRRRSR